MERKVPPENPGKKVEIFKHKKQPKIEVAAKEQPKLSPPACASDDKPEREIHAHRSKQRKNAIRLAPGIKAQTTQQTDPAPHTLRCQPVKQNKAGQKEEKKGDTVKSQSGTPFITQPQLCT